MSDPVLMKSTSPRPSISKDHSAKANRILNLIRKMVKGKTTLEKVRKHPDSSPFKVLISTMLSARTRDSVTEAASARLLTRYPDANALSHAKKDVVTVIIRPVSFFNVKAARVIQVSRELEEKFSGKVPRELEMLLELPGVGRKTANCVLVYGFSKPAIPVDVHVHRVSNRIGLVNTEEPEATETELSMIYDRRKWLDVNELFVRFGQTICKPIGPKCAICSVRGSCKYYKMKSNRES